MTEAARCELQQIQAAFARVPALRPGTVMTARGLEPRAGCGTAGANIVVITYREQRLVGPPRDPTNLTKDRG
jgi:hypothetical protein